jgi:hypothetical protein
MPSKLTRRALLGICSSAIGVSTAGCISDSDSPTTSSRSNHAANSTNSTDTEASTVSPSTVSDERAKQRALAAEEDYLQGQLSDASCLSDWGTTASVTNSKATVQTRTSDGVRVNVTHPYWWTKRWTETNSNKSHQSNADAASEARYLVTSETDERLSGDRVEPC